jgi:lysophospholipase L1-like esterase
MSQRSVSTGSIGGGRCRRNLVMLGLLALAWLPAAGWTAAEDVPDRWALPADEEGLPGEGPLRRYEAYVKRWPELRRAWAGRVQQDRGAVVFLGDSITAGWGERFHDLFPDMKLANRGIGGDTTRGMLLRIDEDVLALDPAAIVLLAGTNDIEIGVSPEAISRNVGRLIERVKAHDSDRQPFRATPIVLCRVLPSSATKNRPADTIRRLNTLVDDLVRGDPQIILLDTWTLFANAAGDADSDCFPDLLHLNPAGYLKWGKGLRPVFATLGLVERDEPPFELEEGFESLFNGHDLTGWGFRPTPPRKPVKNPKPDAPVWVEITAPERFDGLSASSDGRYRAIGGRLVVVTPPEGRRIQQLWTTREFARDFILRLEFRATPNADSGVFIRQPQLQCRDYGLAGPWQDLAGYRPQEWNALEVRVSGERASATCNGQPLGEPFAVPATGPIGLEGDRGQMEYRRLRIKELPPTAGDPASN